MGQDRIYYSSGSQSTVPEPTATAALRSLLGIHILRAHPRTMTQKLEGEPEGGVQLSVLKSPSHDS